MKLYITSRKYETPTLHAVLQDFKTTDCDWLEPPGRDGAQKKATLGDSLKRRELLEDFMFWYFDEFLLNLLRVSRISLARSHSR